MNGVNYELKSAIVQASKRFMELGYSPVSDAGDLSLRDPETGYIYFSPNRGPEIDIPDWNHITEDDVVVCDPDGKIVENTHGIQPTCEHPMHLAIYKARPDANAIVHSHCLYTSAFAVAGKDIPLVLSEMRMFGEDIHCPKEFGPAGSDALTYGVVEALGQVNKAALVRNHGAACIGANMREAFQVSIYVERLAHTCILATVLGGLNPIPSEFKRQ
jgi:L-fuculose-phosphate aldolase